MKRHNNLFEPMLAFENLHHAFRLASRGKRNQPEVIRYRYSLEPNLFALRDRLLEGGYDFGPYWSFMVHDPKPRHIVAAPFEDRVVHHAMCNVMEPIFEKVFIHDSYACRDGKGTHAAVFRLQNFMRKAPEGYVLQCDIRKYFQSADHAILKTLIRRKIKDTKLLALTDRVIDSAPVHPDFGAGKGLPIGNLTSQLFANVYLNPLDHFVKETLRCKRYVRYVDDFAVVDEDKTRLHEVKADIAAYLDDALNLSLHGNKSQVFPIRKGCTFLGYRVWPYRRRVRTTTMVRIRRKERELRRAYWADEIPIETYRQTIDSFLGHMKWGDEGGFLTKQLLE